MVFVLDKILYFKYNIYAEQLNNIYIKNGITGIFNNLKRLHFRIISNKYRSLFLLNDNKFIWIKLETFYINLTLKSLRDRYLLGKLQKFLISKIKKKDALNTVDLSYNTFNLGQNILLLGNHRQYWKFSQYDIFKIFQSNLEYSEDLIALPKKPVNPYNNQEFNIYDLTQMYNFLLNNKFKIPEITFLFRRCNFNFEIFKNENSNILDKNACQSYVKDLSFNKLQRLIKRLNLFLISVNKDNGFNVNLLINYFNKFKFSILSIMSNFIYLYEFLDDTCNEYSYYKKKITGNMNRLRDEIKHFDYIHRKYYIVKK